MTTDKAAPDELKSCPLEHPVVKGVKVMGIGSSFIYCRDCGLESRLFATPAEAITFWNKREGDEIKEDLTALQIVADLINDIPIWKQERATNKRWYLGAIKLERVFVYLAKQAYLKDDLLEEQSK